MAEKHEVYVKCSPCNYEGMVLLSDNASIYEVICPQCGRRTPFRYFIFPVGGG